MQHHERADELPSSPSTPVADIADEPGTPAADSSSLAHSPLDESEARDFAPTQMQPNTIKEDMNDNVEQQDVIVPPGFVQLVSGDGFTFIVDEEYVQASSVLRTMLRSGFREARTRVVHLPDMRAAVLERVCQYLYYVARFRHRADGGKSMVGMEEGDGSTGMRTDVERRVGDTEMKGGSGIGVDCRGGDDEVFPVPAELSVDMYLAALYLDL